MEYTQLGRSELSISRIGFGCMSLKNDHGDNERILHQALEFGINYFDTADIYEDGRNEALLGKAFQGIRTKVLIATKVGNVRKADGSGLDWNPGKDHILTAVEGSLQRLKTDYIDLYQLHGGTIKDNMDETIEAFELLVRQGKIRYYGISSIRTNVIREYVKRSNIVSVMMQYSLLDRRPTEEMLQLLHESNIGVLARGSVSSGLLVDKPAKPYLNYDETQVQQAANAIKTNSGINRSGGQTAVQFVLQNSAIASAVVGIRTLDQLKDAATIFEASQLTEFELGELSKAIAPNRYDQHR